MIEVLNPGAASSLQGRRAWRRAHLGIPLGGPADGYSQAAANRMVGNPDDATAIEMTLLGATLRFTADAEVALCGAPFEASVPLWRPVRVAAGETVTVRGTPQGARCYLAVRGGLLGSGNLAKGMELRSAGLPGGDRQLSGGARLFDGLIRYTAAEPRQELRYTVTNEVNRRGIRLQGPALEPGHEMITEGVNAGAIQVPPSGQPLIVFYDQTTTGGYPKLGTVIRADLDRLGQLRPRDTIRLQWIAVEDALQLARE